jgi:hypothetical protein
MGCVLEVDVDGEGVFFVDKVTASSSSSTPAFFFFFQGLSCFAPCSLPFLFLSFPFPRWY